MQPRALGASSEHTQREGRERPTAPSISLLACLRSCCAPSSRTHAVRVVLPLRRDLRTQHARSAIGAHRCRAHVAPRCRLAPATWRPYMFKWLVSQLWATTLGVAVDHQPALAYPLRAWAAMRARPVLQSGHPLPRQLHQHQRWSRRDSCRRVASTLVVVLFTAIGELQERGAAIDAACYAAHCPFYLGVGFAPALHRREHRHDDDDERDDHSANGQASPLPSSPHTLALAVMASPSAAAPFAASAVAVGALGVLPSNCCHQCHAQNAPWRSWCVARDTPILAAQPSRPTWCGFSCVAPEPWRTLCVTVRWPRRDRHRGALIGRGVGGYWA